MLNLELSPLSGFDGVQAEKVGRAVAIVNRVINSQQFEETLIAHSGLLYTRGLSNREVLDTLRSGRRFDGSPSDGPVRVAYFLEASRGGSAIGRTDGNGVHTYRDYFDSASDEQLAGHIAHEALCHFACGFSQPFWNVFGWRNRSVPYVVGDMVTALA